MVLSFPITREITLTKLCHIYVLIILQQNRDNGEQSYTEQVAIDKLLSLKYMYRSVKFITFLYVQNDSYYLMTFSLARFSFKNENGAKLEVPYLSNLVINCPYGENVTEYYKIYWVSYLSFFLSFFQKYL